MTTKLCLALLSSLHIAACQFPSEPARLVEKLPSGDPKTNDLRPPFVEPYVTALKGVGSATWLTGIGLPDGEPTDARYGLQLIAPSAGEVGAIFYGVAGERSLGA